MTSINQWQSLAVDLGGDQARVDTILSNTSTDAHDYEPTTADIARISRADLVIVNGAGIDDWAAKAAETGQARLVDISKASGHKAGDNPHLWFSSQSRRAAAKAVHEAYRQLRPGRGTDFDKAYQDWQGRQARLDDLIAKARKQTQGRHYAATESAAYYLCHDLGMEDLTPEGYLRAAANESEPSPEDLVAFRHLLASSQLDMLVLNTQEVNRTSKDLAIEARKAHVPVFEVSEQRPDKYRNLEDWISALVQQVPGAKA
ncbi:MULTISPECIES: metal ABC transporter solute-binding protein, Zn/Mn family [Bifidobacterium]|uniref:Zinc ABC transporter substrate-binding protein n=1 Tax=Bifidobacterium asteroides TaxID=1684 RepID=A0ABS3IRD0_9BIFI|nr:zinc ABC transporter substrate-binding protein [Bifidobacterium polysaccharolyticum]